MILVAGGTGFVGSAVVKELRRRGEAVAVLSRDSGKVKALFGDDVETREADVTNPADLAGAFSGIDVVINAVQFPNSPVENKRKGWTFEQIDRNGTINQVAAAKSAGVRRFVYVSGAGAAPDAAQHWFRHKAAAEQSVQESGLEWAIVRPTWVFGPGDHSLNRIVGFGKFLPFIPIFGNGKAAMQPIFIDDLARIVADAAQKPEAAGHVFEAGGPEVMPMNDVIRTALAVQGKKRPILHQPIILGKLIGTIASLLPTPPLSADAVEFIANEAVGDTATLREVLKPRLTPLREGLAAYMGKQD